MQINLFDGAKQFINNKPIRLIELFGGISAQATALHELGIDFEHYRYVDFDKYAVKSTNAMYGTDWEATDITKIKASDLGVVETDKYDYIMTYSFPCQDLSLAGKGMGMAKGSDTRSGLLWEVERLLNEMHELPQGLLMENVPQVHGKKNIDSFREWQSFLESKGYKNYWQDLNAKNYGIPQNRNRTFMVSLLGDYYYNFPQETKLELRLKDMLEDEVDEKYYLSDKVISKLNFNKQNITETIGIDLNSKKSKFREIASTIRARYDCGYENFTPGPTGIIEPKCEVVATLDIPGRFESACRVHGIDGIAPACNTCGGGGLETKIAEPTILQRPHGFNKGAELEHCPSITTRPEGFKTAILPIVNYRVRKLTPKECWRLMGFRDELFDKAQSVNSNSQLYKQAGNSIVTTVLMAIFGELLDIEWQSKVKNLINDIEE